MKTPVNGVAPRFKSGTHSVSGGHSPDVLHRQVVAPATPSMQTPVDAYFPFARTAVWQQGGELAVQSLLVVQVVAQVGFPVLSLTQMALEEQQTFPQSPWAQPPVVVPEPPLLPPVPDPLEFEPVFALPHAVRATNPATARVFIGAPIVECSTL